MGRYTGRLIFAILLSAGSFFGTEYWYEQSVLEASMGSAKQLKNPIAILQEALNDVQKKSSRKIIWEDISKDDLLYPGESLRTNSDAEAKIFFIKSKTLIELEPDSLIVLEESSKGLSLNFLKGNLFVKNKEGAPAGAANLILKSGNSEIDIKNSSLSLSKKTSGDVSLDVFEGSATIKGKDGKEKKVDNTKSGVLSDQGLKISKEKIIILSPSPKFPVYIDPTKNQKLGIKWKKISGDYNVFIESGRRRSKLKRNSKIMASGSDGLMNIKSKLGKFYWRLKAVAKPGKILPDMTSKVLPLKIIAKIPPKLIFPKHNQKVVLKSDDPDVKLKWTNQSKLSNLFLEVSKKPDLSTKVYETSLKSKKTLHQINIREPGTYFWRITGYMKIKGRDEGLSSPIHMFKISVIEELHPPKLIYPKIGMKLSYKKFKKQGLTLKWDPEPSAKKYRIKVIPAKIKSSKTKSQEFIYTTEASQYKITDLEPGWHYWTVASVGKTNKVSEFTKPNSFKLFDLPKIIWSGGSAYSEHFYVTEKPSFSIKWTAPKPELIKEFRIKYSIEDKFSTTKQWTRTKFNNFKKYVPKEGTYSFIVEGISKLNKIIARSDIKTIYVKAQQRLPAPVYQSSVPQIIKSTKSGNLNVYWESVEGAKQYLLQLKSINGEVIKEKIVKGTNGALNGLKPGSYKVSLVTVDRYNRQGPSGEERQVSVPKGSNIKAPSLKGIKIN
jgi:hypothetical protein